MTRRSFVTSAALLSAALNTFGADTSAIAGVWTGSFMNADRKGVALVYVVNADGTGRVSVSGVKSTVTVTSAVSNGATRYRLIGGSLDRTSRCLVSGSLEGGHLVGTLDSVPAGISRSLSLTKKG